MDSPAQIIFNGYLNNSYIYMLFNSKYFIVQIPNVHLNNGIGQKAMPFLKYVPIHDGLNNLIVYYNIFLINCRSFILVVSQGSKLNPIFKYFIVYAYILNSYQ